MVGTCFIEPCTVYTTDPTRGNCRQNTVVRGASQPIVTTATLPPHYACSSKKTRSQPVEVM
jgi:hypothetical protein